MGATGIVYHAYCINTKYENFMTKCSELKSGLNKLKTKYFDQGELAKEVEDNLEEAKREAENNM